MSYNEVPLVRVVLQERIVALEVLSVTTHINCIVVRCLINVMCLYQVMMTLHFLNDVPNDAESTQNRNYVIIASLKSETMGRLINRIPGSRHLISSLPGSALRTHVDIARLARQASRCQQAFSSPAWYTGYQKTLT